METLELHLKTKLVVPLEGENIAPAKLMGKSVGEVAATPLLYGKEEVPLGDFFTIRGNGCTGHLHLEGDLAKVKYLGAGMDQGLLTITGPVGMHLGSGMSGGEIKVEGAVDDWLGAGMGGGIIRVAGSAGHCVGGGYRGERRGMTGGTIIVHGSVGNEPGARMGRGMVVITGDCGDFPCAYMGAGTLLVLGRCGLHPGANMNRGTLILAQGVELLPTFAYCCTYQPHYLSILWKHLGQLGVVLPQALLAGTFDRYLGDTNELGKGEILVCRNGQAA